MFSKLTDYLANIKFKSDLESNPILRDVILFINEELNQSETGRSIHEDLKRSIAERFAEEYSEIFESESPALKNREKLVAFSLGQARYHVLLLNSIDPNQFLINMPGVTGELNNHLQTIVNADTELKGLIEESATNAGQDPQRLDLNNISLIIHLYFWRSGLFTSACNTIRIGLKDFDEDPELDWYRPMYATMCASQEDQYREEIGLPPAIDDPNASIEMLRYSLFYKFVLDGYENPKLAWESEFKREFPKL